jgi:hypothetical protein
MEKGMAGGPLESVFNDPTAKHGQEKGCQSVFGETLTG